MGRPVIDRECTQCCKWYDIMDLSNVLLEEQFEALYKLYSDGLLCLDCISNIVSNIDSTTNYDGI